MKKLILVIHIILAIITCQLLWAEDDISNIRDIKAIQYEVTGQLFEPLQNITPYSPSRHVSNYKKTILWNPAENKLRQDWQHETFYPYSSTPTFQFINDATRGYRTGSHRYAHTEDGVMEPARIGAELKSIWLSNPSILEAYADQVALTGDRARKGGIRKSSLFVHGTYWTVTADNTMGYPIEISTLEQDPLEGEVVNRITLSDWRVISGVPFPFRLEQKINDKLIRREIRHSIEVNPQGAEQDLILPTNKRYQSDTELQLWGWNMSQFFHRRMAMGAAVDNDESIAVDIVEVGPGLYHVKGSSHHNLLIEGPDGLAMVDAVWYPKRSENILKHIEKKWPDKKLKYTILTHHHIDHVGGVNAYAEAGSTVVTSKQNHHFFQTIISNNVSTAPTFIAIDGTGSLDGIGRRIEMYDIPNSHADGYLAVYIPDEKFLYNVDLYSPNRNQQHPVWNDEYRQGIEYYGIDVNAHIGGHGTGTAPHSDLLELN